MKWRAVFAEQIPGEANCLIQYANRSVYVKFKAFFSEQRARQTLRNRDSKCTMLKRKYQEMMMNRLTNLIGCKPLHGVWMGALVLLVAVSASAGIHTWDVVEVFSNADGTIQYVELLDRGATGTEVGVGNGSLTSGAHSFSWTNGPVVAGPAPGTSGKSYLVATAAFAALPGAPVPDVIIPAANVPFFNVAGDTVTFAGVDSLIFGAVPTNGTDSLTEPVALAGTVVGPNTPKNYAGTQGSVNAAPAVPSGSMPAIVVTVTILLGMGLIRLQRSRAAV